LKVAFEYCQLNVGVAEGASVGSIDGYAVVGARVGNSDGAQLGSVVGSSVGTTDDGTGVVAF
jgi:hypothetical protein